MANHKQALKRHRQSLKRRERNVAVKTRLRNLMKKLRSSIDNSKANEAQDLMKEVVPAAHRAAQKGVIPEKRAARIISRSQIALNKISS